MINSAFDPLGIDDRAGMTVPRRVFNRFPLASIKHV
jgi:hypothetical protein